MDLKWIRFDSKVHYFVCLPLFEWEMLNILNPITQKSQGESYIEIKLNSGQFI